MGVQDRHPNFREDGQLFLVRCFVCSTTPRGRENWAMAVAKGTCAHCGWTEEGEAQLVARSQEPRGSDPDTVEAAAVIERLAGKEEK